MARRARKQNVRRPLDADPHVITLMVKSRHELVGRVEGNFCDARQVFDYRVGVEPHLRCQGQQGPFRGIADHFAIPDAGIDTQDCRQQDMTQAAAAFEIAIGTTAFPANREAAAMTVERPGAHLVERQRSCLVGADDGGAAQRLDGGELPGDGVASGHAMHAERQRHGHHCRQAFRDGGNGQCDGCHGSLCQRVAAHQAENEHQRDDSTGNHRQPLAEIVDLPLQRRLALGGVGQQAGNFAHLGVHAGGGDDGLQPTMRDHGVHEHHVVPFRQHRLSINGRGMFGHRVRFTCQHGFCNFDTVRH